MNKCRHVRILDTTMNGSKQLYQISLRLPWRQGRATSRLLEFLGCLQYPRLGGMLKGVVSSAMTESGLPFYYETP